MQILADGNGSESSLSVHLLAQFMVGNDGNLYLEDKVQSLLLSLLLHQTRTGDDHSMDT